MMPKGCSRASVPPVAGCGLRRQRQRQGLGGEGTGLDGAEDRQASQAAVGEGGGGRGAAIIPEGLHRVGEALGGGAQLLVDGSKPQDEQGLRESATDGR